MASTTTLFLVASLLIISSPTASHARHPWFQTICKGKESLAKVHFYVQDLLDGPNTTVYEVARSSISSSSPTTFGQVRVLDDLLTAEPDINSTKLGRAQGLITSADLGTFALAMNLNFVFTAGPYKGSTISVAGRNQINDQERELPVIGGTGIFRFARGFAVTRTHSYDVQTSYGVLEYTLYVTYVKELPIDMKNLLEAKITSSS